MNQFQLSFSIPEFSSKIEHGKQLLFLGSCFSDELAAKAKYTGFSVDSNPFGTIFHPLALSRFILETLADSEINERIIEREDLCFSWDANSTFFGTSEIEINKKLFITRQNWRIFLSSADFLFVTFGTAWGYVKNDTKELVANCHKFPSIEFEKVLTEQTEIISAWQKVLTRLKKLNPALKVVFTVSPVRHSKDGLIANNQSKSILIDSLRQLIKNNTCFYFPSYEIVIDELRDYRFFKTDRVHPNDEAIQYIWERFGEVFFSQETMQINREVIKLRLEEAHKSIFPESLENTKRLEQLQLTRLKLTHQFPEIQLD